MESEIEIETWMRICAVAVYVLYGSSEGAHTKQNKHLCAFSNDHIKYCCIEVTAKLTSNQNTQCSALCGNYGIVRASIYLLAMKHWQSDEVGIQGFTQHRRSSSTSVPSDGRRHIFLHVHHLLTHTRRTRVFVAKWIIGPTTDRAWSCSRFEYANTQSNVAE